MKRNNKKGFTIVELVIVIAVIAILSAVLIPTFGGVIDRANASKAQQEVKNIHTLYLADVDFVAGEEIEEVFIKYGADVYKVTVDGKITLAEGVDVAEGYTALEVKDVPANTVYVVEAEEEENP